MSDPTRTTGPSPKYGTRLGYAIFHGILRSLGVAPAYVLLACIVPYYVLFRPSARRAASHYLKRRFPHQGPVRRFLMTILYFFRFGQTLVDQGAMGILGPDRFRVEFPGQERLYQLAQEQRGLILLTTHVGCWQSAMANMACLGVPVHLQFHVEGDRTGRHFFDLAGTRQDLRIIPPSGFLGGMIEMTNALREGQCVAVMGDRAWGARTRPADFLGEEAEFPITAYHLAAVTGADLVMFLTVRTGRLAYRIESVCLTADPPSGQGDEGRPERSDWGTLPRDEAVDLLLRRYVEHLERYIEKHPLMWFNFFDFWAGGKETRSD